MAVALKKIGSYTDPRGNEIWTLEGVNRKGNPIYRFASPNMVDPEGKDVSGRDVDQCVKVEILLGRFIGGEKLEDIAASLHIPVSYAANWLQQMQNRVEQDKVASNGDKVSYAYTVLTSYGIEFPTKKLAFWFRENPAEKSTDVAKTQTLKGLSGLFGEFVKQASPKKG